MKYQPKTVMAASTDGSENPRSEAKSAKDEDLVETMLKKSGCLEFHYAVQECIAETKDWRQCQKHVQTFRSCVEEHQERQKTSFQKS